tara:strand:+ start:14322 stop:14504 length:183 start_codon:yes stop_codon:yes gene_type:complete
VLDPIKGFASLVVAIFLKFQINPFLLPLQDQNVKQSAMGVLETKIHGLQIQNVSVQLENI